ncbi:UDP-glucose 4-epimerase GalE [Brevundimonas sp. TWP2-3-4b1]|uniref:UDP-glucose 4-epimerase GalE n=1 Tax=Brevundimonas sp. TWP2-3-4b1 TaxID=2804580 RepID=UPI003CEBC638
MTRNILVTGGAGYIGSHACKALAEAGYLPVVYDNLSLGRHQAVLWGPLVEGDIRDADRVARTLRDHEIQAVIHFAALSVVGESGIRPLDYYGNNVGGLLGLLKGMAAATCDTLVFSSTAAVYGEPRVSPIPEDSHTEPLNVYGRTKLICETILADTAAAHGVKVVSLRYFNACGADVEGRIGEFRRTETHLIPRALMALQGHIEDFMVFGSDFPTPDGTAIRDYIHVEDLAEAHVLALKRLLNGDAGGTFNLGTGHGYSVGEILATISRITGHTLAAPQGGRRAGDPARLVADGSRARTQLGFIPTRSSLDNIVATAWRWHQIAHPTRNSV